MGDGVAVRAGVTIGIARFPEDGGTGEELLRAVALASQRAHENPDVAYDFYARDLSDDVRQRFELERRLRDAIANERLEPHFQPQVSLDDRSLIGFEALVRWPSTDGQRISPAEFIPLAEQTGLILPLGRFMLRAVATQVQAWQEEGLQVPPIAVNCSAMQFRGAQLVDDYTEAVLQRGLKPDSVALEVTESTLLNDFELARTVMTELRDKGVHFSIDDFGTGFSSLGYLTQLPFGTLKIDRSFVSAGGIDSRQQSVVRALVQMGGTLDLFIVAEGIETAEQEATMQGLGCNAGQGYLYSPALAASDARQWLSTAEA